MAHSCSQTHCPGLFYAGHPKEKDTKADQRDLETTILKDLKIGSLTMETVLRVAADRTRLSGLKHQTDRASLRAKVFSVCSLFLGSVPDMESLNG